MAAPKKYGDELRERATRMAVEAAMAVPPDVPGRMQLVAAGAARSGDRPGSPRWVAARRDSHRSAR